MKISTQYFLFKSTAILTLGLATAVHAQNCQNGLRAPIVVVHNLASDYLPAEARMSFRVISDGYTPNGYSDLELIWSRDRFPIRVELPDGRIKLLQYASLINTTGWPFYDGGSTYAPVLPPANAPINAKLFSINGVFEWIQVETMPIVMEGGNLQLGNDFMLVGEKVFQENTRSANDWCVAARECYGDKSKGFQTGLTSGGYRARTKDEVKNILASNTSIALSRIFEMPWMPGERTGHVDLYVGKLSASTVVVPQIPQAFIDRLSMNHERTFASSTTQWLDAQAAALKGRGIRVLRFPMLPPRNLRPSSISPLGWDAQFPSTVNFIVDGRRVYIPDFPNFAAQLGPEVEQQLRSEITQTLAAEGFSVIFANSEAILQHGGLLHCISGEI